MTSSRLQIAAWVASLLLAGWSCAGRADGPRIVPLPRYESPQAQPPARESPGYGGESRDGRSGDGRGPRPEPAKPPAAPPSKWTNKPVEKGAGPREPNWTRQPHRDPHPPTAGHPKPGPVIDRRHGQRHHYPPPGYLAPVLPPRHRVIRHRFDTYYYHGGTWYAPSGTRYVVVRPPVGVSVRWLPPYYRVCWVRSIPYYYAGGIYYNWAAQYGHYVVADTPAESDIVYPAGDNDTLIVYPAQNQSEEQQETDRDECHQWAVRETGFDPSQLDGRITPEQYPALRNDYNRAQRACLEGRGYSVQ